RRKPWIVALSGGPDSIALSKLLQHAREDDRGRKIVPEKIFALHVHHGLRGVAGDDDAAFARSAAETMGFEFVMKKLTPPAFESGSDSLETWARHARYKACKELAEAGGARVVLTGHQKNDQAETVLQRLLRGAGFKGLSGIRPVRPIYHGSPCLVARPLLDISRHEIEAYLSDKDVSFVEDQSNLDIRIARNRIRWKLLPALVEGLPENRLIDELYLLAESARAIDRLLTIGARKFLGMMRSSPSRNSQPEKRLFIPFASEGHEGGRGSALRLDADRYRKLHEVLHYPVLAQALEQRFPDKSFRLTKRIFETIDDAVMEMDPKGCWHVGDRIRITLSKDRIAIDEQTEPSPEPRPTAFLSLTVPGQAVFPDRSRFQASISEDRTEADHVRANADPFSEVLDADRAGPHIEVRPRRPGDRFHPLGAPGSKKLKDFLIDRKVPKEAREGLALVCSQGKILWVVGLGIHHAFRVTDKTKRFLILTVDEPVHGMHTPPDERE
ncbi:MAG: tRNA lysidine(34) synthetase TilS, partial [Planctomycetes bacterium]|nr:tRNA lysidine(34) synthetase TilS [Planctomycetota bacterium]